MEWLEDRGEWVVLSTHARKADAVEARCVATRTHATRLAERDGSWQVLIECTHEPNARGTQCQHCGIPAEMVTPDELAEALTAEMDAARLRAGGQTSWLDQ